MVAARPLHSHSHNPPLDLRKLLSGLPVSYGIIYPPASLPRLSRLLSTRARAGKATTLTTEDEAVYA